MIDDEAATLKAALVTVLSLPFKVPMASWRARAEAVQSGDDARSAAAVGAIWVAFVPVILLYEAFAVPLVAGTTVMAVLLIVPAGVIGVCWVSVSHVLRRTKRGVRTSTAAPPLHGPAMASAAASVRRD